MHQTILMYTDVHERTEVGDVGDGAFQRHARSQVADFFHAIAQLRGLELRTRIATRLLQLAQNVLNGRQTERRRHVVLRIERTDEAHVANHRLD